MVTGGSGVKSVKVTYASARAPDDLNTRLLRAMIIKGLIEPISSASVNLVVNAPTANTVAAVEHGIVLLTAMARNIASADASLKAGKWQWNKVFGCGKYWGIPTTLVGIFSIRIRLFEICAEDLTRLFGDRIGIGKSGK